MADGSWRGAAPPPVFLCHNSTSFARLEQANLVGVELSELSGATSGAPCLASRCSQTLYNRLLGFWVRAVGFRGLGLVVVALCDAVAGRMQPAVCEMREMHSRKIGPLLCFVSLFAHQIFMHTGRSYGTTESHYLGTYRGRLDCITRPDSSSLMDSVATRRHMGRPFNVAMD